jgi:hypothetical protein
VVIVRQFEELKAFVQLKESSLKKHSNYLFSHFSVVSLLSKLKQMEEILKHTENFWFIITIYSIFGTVLLFLLIYNEKRRLT